MKVLIAFLLSAFISAQCFARGGENDPTPFPLGQAPKDFVGEWTNNSKEESILIEHIPATDGVKEKLFVLVYRRHSMTAHGYLYFDDSNTKYCGIMYRPRGPSYEFCVWKENKQLRTAVYTRGEWSTPRTYGD